MSKEILKGIFEENIAPVREDITFEGWVDKIKDNEEYKVGLFENYVQPSMPDATFEDFNAETFGLGKVEAPLGGAQSAESVSPTESVSSEFEVGPPGVEPKGAPVEEAAALVGEVEPTMMGQKLDPYTIVEEDDRNFFERLFGEERYRRVTERAVETIPALTRLFGKAAAKGVQEEVSDLGRAMESDPEFVVKASQSGLFTTNNLATYLSQEAAGDKKGAEEINMFLEKGAEGKTAQFQRFKTLYAPIEKERNEAIQKELLSNRDYVALRGKIDAEFNRQRVGVDEKYDFKALVGEEFKVGEKELLDKYESATLALPMQLETKANELKFEYQAKVNNGQISVDEANAGLRRDLDAYGAELQKQSDKALEEYNSGVTALAERLEKGVKDKPEFKAYMDELNELRNGVVESFSDDYQKIQQSVFNNVAPKYNSKIETAITNSMRGETPLLDKSGVKGDIAKIVNNRGWDYLAFDQKRAALDTMFGTALSKLKRSGVEINDGVVANLRAEFDDAFMDRAYFTKKGTPSLFMVKTRAIEEAERLDEMIKERKRLMLSQGASKEQNQKNAVARGYGEYDLTSANMLGDQTDIRELYLAREKLQEIIDMPETMSDSEWSNFWNGLTSGQFIDYLPFVSGLKNLSGTLALYRAVGKDTESARYLKNAEALNSTYRNMYEVNNIASDWYKAGKGTAQSLPFMMEFAATAGVGSGVRLGTEKVVVKLLGKQAETVVGKSLKVMAGTLISSLAQTTLNPQRYVDETLKRMTPQMTMAFSPEGDDLVAMLDSSDVEGGFEAALKGFGVTASEYFSEGLGFAGARAMKAVGSKMLQNEFLKRAYVGWYMSKFNFDTPTAFKKIAEMGGWNGFLMEFGEELANIPLTNLITGDAKVMEGIIKDGELDTENLADVARTLLPISLAGGAVSLSSLAIRKIVPEGVTVAYMDANNQEVTETINKGVWDAVTEVMKSPSKVRDFIANELPKLKVDGKGREIVTSMLERAAIEFDRGVVGAGTRQIAEATSPLEVTFEPIPETAEAPKVEIIAKRRQKLNRDRTKLVPTGGFDYFAKVGDKEVKLSDAEYKAYKESGVLPESVSAVEVTPEVEGEAVTPEAVAPEVPALRDVESTAKALDEIKEFKAESDRYFEYVPIEEIEKYKEFDRATEKKWGSADDTLEKLIDDIRKNGIKNPITLQVDGKGNALVVEGNTRLAAAKQLGIKNIPVRIVSGEFGSINKDKTKKIGRRRDIGEMKVFYPNVNILNQENSAASFGFSSITNTKNISEAYHKAKEDGKNSKLVSAVEELLGKSAQTPEAAEGQPAEVISPEVAEALSTEDATRIALESLEVLPEGIESAEEGARIYHEAIGKEERTEAEDAIVMAVEDAVIGGAVAPEVAPEVEVAEAVETAEAPKPAEGKEPSDAQMETKIEEVSTITQIRPKNLRDLYKVNRELFGQNKIKALASAIAMDRMVGAMAKRSGITKAEMYGRLKFEKATQGDVLKMENALFQGVVNGQSLNLRNVDVDVVNGFYSPIEKRLAETKIEKQSANKWLAVIGKGDEAVWTGVKEWLESKNPQEAVSKAEIQQWMKDNRISVVEVVKGVEQEVEEQVLEDETYNNINDELSRKGISDNGLLDAWYYAEENKEQKWEDVVDFLNENNLDVEYLIEKSEINSSAINDTKFSEYQLEGEKENYKEVLVTLPSRVNKPLSKWDFYLSKGFTEQQFDNLPKDQQQKLFNEYKERADKLASKNVADFKSSHFDEPNILVHLRMNTRTDAQGNKVLFLEEVQSDWGQEGKKKGFAIDTEKRIDELVDKRDNQTITEKERQELGDLISQKYKSDVPQAPFVTDTNAWVKLGLKVALKEAVKQGADKIAWTTGEQQNQRYSLEKVADEVRYKKNEDGTYRIVAYKEGENVSEEKRLPESKLEETLGKDVAQRIIDGVGEDIEGQKSLTGENLKVGGKGMKGFYGSPTEGSLGIVGNVAKSLFKQEVGTVEIEKSITDQFYKSYNEGAYTIVEYTTSDGRKEKVFNNEKDAEEFKKGLISKQFSTQNSIDITPELRSEVERGLALFQREQGGQARGAMVAADGSYVVYALTDPNVSTPLHEMAHIFEHYLTPSERNAVIRNARTNGWTTETSEYFARGFERYLAEGSSPIAELNKVFAKFREWLVEIYNGIVGSDIDIELNPEMRKLYDTIFGETAETPKPAEGLTSKEKAEQANKRAEEIAKEIRKNLRGRGGITGITPFSRAKRLAEVDRATLKLIKDYIYQKVLAGAYTFKDFVKDMKENSKRLFGVQINVADSDKSIFHSARSRFEIDDAFAQEILDLKQDFIFAIAAIPGRMNMNFQEFISSNSALVIGFVNRAESIYGLDDQAMMLVQEMYQDALRAAANRAESYTTLEDVKKFHETKEELLALERDMERARINEEIKRRRNWLSRNFDKFKRAFITPVKNFNRAFEYRGGKLSDYRTSQERDVYSARKYRMGASTKANNWYNAIHNKIYGGLSWFEKVELDKYLIYRRIVEVAEIRNQRKAEHKKLEDELAAGVTPVRAEEIAKLMAELEEAGIGEVESGSIMVDGKKEEYTVDLAKAFVSDINARNDALAIKIRSRAEMYTEANNELLKMRLDAGLISKEAYDSMEKRDYVRRLFVDISNTPLDEANYSPVSKQIKAIKKGSKDMILEMDTQALLQINAQITFDSVAKNKFMQKVAEWTKNKQQQYLDKALEKFKDAHARKERYLRSSPRPLTQEEIDKFKKEQSLFMLHSRNKAKPVGFELVPYFVNGKEKILAVRNDMVNVFQTPSGRGINENSFAIKALSAILLTPIIKASAVFVNPAFAIGNFALDVIHASMVTRDLYKSFTFNLGTILAKATGYTAENVYRKAVKFGASLFGRTARDSKFERLVKDYFEHGGGMSGLANPSSRMYSDKLSSSALRRGFGDAKDGIIAVLDVINSLQAGSELITRIIVYEAALEKNIAAYREKNGVDPVGDDLALMKMSAAASAADLIDFREGAETTKVLDQTLLPFLNAMIQGAKAEIDFASKNPLLAATRLAEFGGMALGVALYNANSGDEDEKEGIVGYNGISEYIKSNYFIMMMPWTKKNERGEIVRPFISIKLPAALKATNIMVTGMVADQGAKNTIGQMVSALEGGYVPEIGAVSPTAQIAMALSTNKDAFRKGAPIYRGRPDVLLTERFNAGETKAIYRDLFGAMYDLINEDGENEGVLGFDEAGPAQWQAAFEKAISPNNPYYLGITSTYAAISSLYGKENKREVDVLMDEKFAALNAFRSRVYREPNSSVQQKNIEDRKKIDFLRDQIGSWKKKNDDAIEFAAKTIRDFKQLKPAERKFMIDKFFDKDIFDYISDAQMTKGVKAQGIKDIPENIDDIQDFIKEEETRLSLRLLEEFKPNFIFKHPALKSYAQGKDSYVGLNAEMINKIAKEYDGARDGINYLIALKFVAGDDFKNIVEQIQPNGRELSTVQNITNSKEAIQYKKVYYRDSNRSSKEVSSESALNNLILLKYLLENE